MGKRLMALFLAITLAWGSIEVQAYSGMEEALELSKQSRMEEVQNLSGQFGMEEAQNLSGQPGMEEALELSGQSGIRGEEIPDISPDDGQKPEPPAEEQIFYTVTFDFKGGSTEHGTSFSLQVQKGQAVPQSAVPEPQRPGYLFQGWLDANGIVYQFGQPVYGNLVINASWTAITYRVHFDANGGTGSMQEQAFAYGQTRALLKNRYKRKGCTFAGWNTKKDGSGTDYANKQKVKSLTEENGGTVYLYAMWQGNSYRIKYDGNGATGGVMPDSHHVYGAQGPLSMNRYKRKGYTFAGWNTKRDGTGKSYANGASVKNLTSTKDKVITLYAKWNIITYKITYKPNKGKLSKTARNTYTVATKTFTLQKPVRKGYDFDGWYQDKGFKKRVDQIKIGRTGNLTVYAKWVKCKRKPRADSAKITKCKAVKTKTVQVKASVKQRIASSDDYYYLVYVSPTTNKPYKMAARAFKKKNNSFSLDTGKNQGYVTSRLGIAVKTNGKYQLISSTSFVGSPEKAAANKRAYSPGKTKKGIQFDYGISEVDACNVKQYFLNLTVSMVGTNGTVPYKYNGKTYYFNSMDHYKQLVRECNQRKVTVTMQILLDWTEGHTDLINSSARRPGALYYSWNIYSNKSREKMEAMFCYLGMIFGEKDCYVSNWILGNEVNHPSGWNYAGGMSGDSYFKTYAYTFRALYYAVRSQQSSAHIFICTDNYWNTSRSRRFSARELIDNFAAYLSRVQKGLKWNLAYHAYSFPLTYTRVWNGYGITNDVSTPSVTMKNLHVLTNYIKKRYGSSVRIILSEQGYSSAEGESLQAAALAYSYYVAACNPMIDAFIIRSYSDDPVEVAQGYRLGILGKEAFDVFKYMDTSKAGKYTDRYLGVIGAGSWAQIIPGYRTKRLRTMYRK